MSNTPLVDLVSLLHKHGTDSKQTRRFIDKRSDNATFQRRAAVITGLFQSFSERGCN